MSVNLWSALRSTVLAVMDGWAFNDGEPWSAEEQSRFADEMARTIEQEHAASLVPDNGAEIRQWQREYDALPDHLKQPGDLGIVLPTVPDGYCLLCCESGYAHEPGCPNDPSPLRPDDIHGLCPGGPIPEGATCSVCNMSWQTHRRLVNTLELAPASGEPSGAEARVCPRFGCHARMETRTVCVRCGHYEAGSGAEAVAGERKLRVEWLRNRAKLIRGALDDVGAADVTLDVHDAELLENAADDLEARIHECCDSDDGDAVCHRCGVSMNAVAALRAASETLCASRSGAEAVAPRPEGDAREANDGE